MFRDFINSQNLAICPTFLILPWNCTECFGISMEFLKFPEQFENDDLSCNVLNFLQISRTFAIFVFKKTNLISWNLGNILEIRCVEKFCEDTRKFVKLRDICWIASLPNCLMLDACSWLMAHGSRHIAHGSWPRWGLWS